MDTTDAATMWALRLVRPAGPSGLVLEQIARPEPAPGEALVRVHAAAITRDELDWPVDRLPAIPSYELSGVVAALGPGADGPAIGEEVWALTPFDRDGVAAEFAAVPAGLLAPKPATVGHDEAAAVPLAALSAWQGLFDHGRLQAGERVLIHGAAGGVGHLATQLAHRSGAHVIGTASAASAERAKGYGADEVLDPATDPEPVDLVFDTVGGEPLARAGSVLKPGGRLVSIAEEPPSGLEVPAVYFVVEPNREQLDRIGGMVDAGELRPEIDAVVPLADAVVAFERNQAPGRRGKVVLRVLGGTPDA
jgi:NADPH:quinone reductase-like Zn-dependent oxidoreductase